MRAVQHLGHAKPDEIQRSVREESQAVTIFTVCRALEWFEELEPIQHAHINDWAPTYYSTVTSPHVHGTSSEFVDVRGGAR